MMCRTTIFLLCVILIAGAASAETRRNPEIVDRGSVREVVDGDTVVLDSATQVRLVGIQAPKLALGRPGFRPWPLAEESKALLKTLTLGKSLRLSYGGRRIDRHGRLLAHLEDAEGRWIQGEMLSAGLARVYSFSDNRSRVPDMLALERKARAMTLGIWSNSYYNVRSVAETPQIHRHIPDRRRSYRKRRGRPPTRLSEFRPRLASRLHGQRGAPLPPSVRPGRTRHRRL